jgi:hypothetical protein
MAAALEPICEQFPSIRSMKKLNNNVFFFYDVTKCNLHEFFFDWNCNDCKEEYKNLKGTNKIEEESQEEVEPIKAKKIKKEHDYKEFTEERAKKLYEEIFLQYLKKGNISEAESIERSKKIIRKQCLMRNIEPWSWV